MNEHTKPTVFIFGEQEELAAIHDRLGAACDELQAMAEKLETAKNVIAEVSSDRDGWRRLCYGLAAAVVVLAIGLGVVGAMVG